MEDAGGLTDRIADFVVSTKLVDVPAEAVDGAKLTILDTLGVGLAAADQPTVREICEHVKQLGGTQVSTILASDGSKTSAPLAALANGCSVNALDYDGFWHVPTHVLPAALAVGELVGTNGKAVLEAYIVAAEVANRLRESIDALRDEAAGPTYRGWYHVSVYGPIAAASAAGKLLGLDARGVQAAMSIAACGSGGVRQNLGTSAKSLASGNSAALGVHGALLAQRGISGDPDIIEGRLGLLEALCLPGECDLTPIVHRLGSRYALGGPLGLKAFPSVGPTQAMIGSLRELKASDPFDVTNVEWVEARLSAFSAGTAYPDSPLAAGFSWPYILASTLVHGTFGIEQLTTESLEDRDVRDLASQIRFIETQSGLPQQVTVGLRDGRVVTAKAEGRLGRLETRESIEWKFGDASRRYLAVEDVAALHRAVMDLESLDSIATLTKIVA